MILTVKKRKLRPFAINFERILYEIWLIIIDWYRLQPEKRFAEKIQIWNLNFNCDKLLATRLLSCMNFGIKQLGFNEVSVEIVFREL